MAIREYALMAPRPKPVRSVLATSFKHALVCLLALNTVACGGGGYTATSQSSPGDNLTDPLGPTRDVQTRYSAPIRQGAPLPPRPRGITSMGDDLFVSDPLPDGRLFRTGEKNDLTLNLVDVDIPVAAKTIITDILGLNFVLDDRVTGTITLQTVRPVSRAVLIDLFESVLAAKGFALVRTKDTYRIVESNNGKLGPGGVSPGLGGSGNPGLSAQVIPLRFVSAEDMRNLLASVAPREAVLTADTARNFIIVSGTRAQVNSILETVGLFDVDWMRGMSAAIFPLKSNNPGAIAEELEQLFGSAGGPLRGTIKFVPNTHLNAVLVITSRAEYLRRARELIGRLEEMAVSSESQYFVYKVENRSAKELADVLKNMLSGGNSSSSASSGLSPKLTAASTSSTASGFDKPSDSASGSGDAKSPGYPQGGSGGEMAQADGFGGGGGGGDKGPSAAGLLASSRSAAASDAGGGGSGGGGNGGNGPTIVADDQNNSIIITGTRLQYEKVLRILATLDSPPIQVLLEAVIAEVTLNDELKFGVRWFLNHHHYKLSEADNATTSNATTILAGLNFAAKFGAIDSLLNTLSAVTDVKVVSTPSLTVLDNHVARLQVGDEVPIVKQTATSTASSTAATVTDVEMKNTGVILSVTPRVNQNGLVLLDIEQEVSDVVNTTSSSINSPTIQQRKVSTTVIVQDGQTLTLGGLVQDKKLDSRTRFPLVGRMPVIGPLFGSTDNTKTRTELMVFVRPRVLRNTEEGRQATDEFRAKLGNLFRPASPTQWRRAVGDDLERMGR